MSLKVFIFILIVFYQIGCFLSQIAQGQILPDSTLGQESSTVTESRQSGSFFIEGGAKRGDNLFHSFQEFNISTGGAAYFLNPLNANNIFTRITGNNPSNIFGTLGVVGSGNFFFINPNGIIFGEQATLDINGAFVGTTSVSFG